MVCCEQLNDLAYFSGAYAGCANVSVLDFSIPFDCNSLQIGQPTAFAHIVGMADAMTYDGPFSTDFAFSAHYLDLP
jgi:hypothetical protein